MSEMNQSFQEVLKIAVQHVQKSTDKESGGIILRKGDTYQFIPCENKSSNQVCIYEPAMGEVFKLMSIDPEWTMHASIHNHPYWPSCPSQLDLRELFQSFPVNYIYSNLTNKLDVYDVDDTEHSVHEICLK